jgi:phosphatidylserine synthase
MKGHADGVGVQPPSRAVSAADLLTIGNGVCGLAIIVIATGIVRAGIAERGLDHHELLACAGLIVLGCALDVLDGAVAARRGSSGRGEKLDVMCDAITFAIAPGTMLISAFGHRPGSGPALGALAAAILLVASLLRLSRPCHETTASGFRGLTMPGGAAGVTALLVLHADPALALLGTSAISALLASSVPYPSCGPRSLPLVGSAWVLAVAGVAGALPLWPAAVATLASVLLAPLLVLGTSRRNADESFAAIATRTHPRPRRLTPARTRSPLRTVGSIAGGITRSTRDPKRIMPMRSPWTIRSPTRR